MKTAIILITLLCVGCDAGFKPTPENKGLYNCENALTNVRVRFNPEDATIWNGTAGVKLEITDMISGKELVLLPKHGWSCVDGAGKVHED